MYASGITLLDWQTIEISGIRCIITLQQLLVVTILLYVLLDYGPKYCLFLGTGQTSSVIVQSIKPTRISCGRRELHTNEVSVSLQFYNSLEINIIIIPVTLVLIFVIVTAAGDLQVLVLQNELRLLCSELK